MQHLCLCCSFDNNPMLIQLPRFNTCLESFMPTLKDFIVCFFSLFSHFLYLNIYISMIRVVAILELLGKDWKLRDAFYWFVKLPRDYFSPHQLLSATSPKAKSQSLQSCGLYHCLWTRSFTRLLWQQDCKKGHWDFKAIYIAFMTTFFFFFPEDIHVFFNNTMQNHILHTKAWLKQMRV